MSHTQRGAGTFPGQGKPRMTATDSTFWLETYQEHGSAVMAFLTSRLGRRDLAEDLLQETFVRVIRTGRTLPDSRKIRSYLFTTAHRLIIDRSRRKRPVLFSEATDREASRFENLADAVAPSPEAVADFHRLEEQVRAVLDRVKPDHRVAFEQAVLQQKSYAVVAREQGWTLAQVKTNVHRARKRVVSDLRSILRPVQEREP